MITADDDVRRVQLIAHRGFAAERPENTVGAVRYAASRADAIEIDVRRCGSGDLVAIHDRTVDRVTDGSGPVAEHTLAELRDLSVLGTDEGVPALSEVFAAVPPDVRCNVELKETGIAGDAVAAIEETDVDAFVSSFSKRALREAAAADAAVPTAYLFARLDRRRQPIERARSLGCAFLHPPADRCSAALVETTHDAGLRINAWTVDDRARARRLADRGVDGIITNRSDLFDDR